MGKYFPPIEKEINNISFHSDGSVTVSFTVVGINVNVYKDSSVTYGQSANDDFFSAFTDIESNDFMISALYSRIPPLDTMERMVKGIKNFEPSELTGLNRSLSELYAKTLTGEYEESQRVYLFSVKMSSNVSKIDQFLAKSVIELDNTETVSLDYIKEFEEKVFRAIPQKFRPERISTKHLIFAHERSISRGLPAPQLNRVEFDKNIINPDSKSFHKNMFSPVEIKRHALHRQLFSQFVKEVKNNKSGITNKSKRIFDKSFSTFKNSTVLGIHQVGTKNSDFPDGLTSYQTIIEVGLYSTSPSYDINSLTSYADQNTGCDIDWAIRWSYDSKVMTVDSIAENVSNLEQESKYNSKNEYIKKQYSRKKSTFDVMDTEVRDRDRAAIGVAATLYFAIGSANIDHLNASVALAKKHFSSCDIITAAIPAGQLSAWLQMIPGSSVSQITQDFKQVTTARRLGASIPLRSSFAGDPYGLAIAFNRENKFNQLILHDIESATDKGTGSFTSTGVPRSGKSIETKTILGHYLDSGYYAHIIDISDIGEYVTYCSQFVDTAIVDLSNPATSLDVLKIFNASIAQKVFLELYLPLLGISEGSKSATLLANILSGEYRKNYRLKTTRDVINHLSGHSNSEYLELKNKFQFWGSQEYAHTFIDPIVENEVVNIPAFKSQNKCVVFRTHGLKPPSKTADTSSYSSEEKYSVFVYNSIARITANRFQSVSSPCVFVADEVSVFFGTNVVDIVMKDTARTEAKSQSSMLISTQLSQDLGRDYDLIKKGFAFRQDSKEGSIPALTRLGIEPTEEIIERHITDTSPFDPLSDNFVDKSRPGECWYADGFGNIVRAQGIPPLIASRFEAADTTSTKMVTAAQRGLVKSTSLKADAHE